MWKNENVTCKAWFHRSDLSWSGGKDLWCLLPRHAPVTAAVACNVRRVRWVLPIPTGQRPCTPDTQHCTTSRTGNACFHSIGSAATYISKKLRAYFCTKRKRNNMNSWTMKAWMILLN